MLEVGHVVRFHYLWRWQHLSGEVSGRKARPVCVLVKTPSQPSAVFLFPLTTKEPDEETSNLPVSRAECRRAGISGPSWVILNEFNRVDLDKAYDFESLTPTGRFSDDFLRQIAKGVNSVRLAKKLATVPRI